MANRIEPPILISRLMTFVFASSLVVLGVLLFTLYNMFPLNRPQVFFLFTNQRGNLTVSLEESPLKTNQDKDKFMTLFVNEYVRARNEVVKNAGSMQRKWNNDGADEFALVRKWSTDEVYQDFMETDMYNELMRDITDFDFECSVEFDTNPVRVKSQESVYNSSFTYVCQNNDRQLVRKKYTVRITLQEDYDTKTKWTARLVNPLGIRVSGYETLDGDDPLNVFVGSEEEGKETE